MDVITKSNSNYAIMKTLSLWTALFFALPGLPFAIAKNIFYVDSRNGNDNNNGKSSSTAWKTLDKLNMIIFKAGDLIYLRRGQSFYGSLILKGSGKNGNPIQLLFLVQILPFLQ